MELTNNDVVTIEKIVRKASVDMTNSDEMRFESWLEVDQEQALALFKMKRESETERITVRANPNCKYCLGSGFAMGIYPGEHVCRCVTEQLRIIVTEKDYSIRERITPGNPEIVKEQAV